MNDDNFAPFDHLQGLVGGTGGGCVTGTESVVTGPGPEVSGGSV